MDRRGFELATMQPWGASVAVQDVVGSELGASGWERDRRQREFSGKRIGEARSRGSWDDDEGGPNLRSQRILTWLFSPLIVAFISTQVIAHTTPSLQLAPLVLCSRDPS
ncbi:hypothetical protein CC2G_006603 [Coprinopsis cinerea AmutBmut pab1-1]|nr:hypothetical protein CC2G_006603 [Coprinopsis cinerea AmutBmut pab1-1]